MGEDRPEVAQRVHGLDMGADVGRVLPRLANVCGQVSCFDGRESPVIDVDPIRRRRDEFAPVEPGTALLYKRLGVVVSDV